MPKSKLLIDGDLIVHKITASLETPCEWHNNIWTIHTDVAEALTAFKDYIYHIKEVCDGDEVVITFSDVANFRKHIFPNYKGNRVGNRKPVGFKALQNMIEDSFDCVTMYNLEADDAMGILQTDPSNKKNTIIVSEDKDMMTIPGTVYAKKSLKQISHIKANRIWMAQTMCGDTADNYKGCPGVGIKTAEKILGGLSDLNEMWGVVVETFLKKGLGFEDALTSARLARILRYEDYNDKGEIKLWTP